MLENIRDLLDELKAGLRHLYGKRLRGVYLFGSYARGGQDSESDLDVLIILDCLDHYGAEIDRTGYLDRELSLKFGVSISTIFMPEQSWILDNTPLLRNVRQEAVAV
jgi:predicted nucleotidyltransferase